MACLCSCRFTDAASGATDAVRWAAHPSLNANGEDFLTTKIVDF